MKVKKEKIKTFYYENTPIQIYWKFNKKKKKKKKKKTWKNSNKKKFWYSDIFIFLLTYIVGTR